MSHQVDHVSAVAAKGPDFFAGMPKEQNCLARERRAVLPGCGLQALRMLKWRWGVRPGICLDFGKPGCVLVERGGKGTKD